MPLPYNTNPYTMASLFPAVEKLKRVKGVDAAKAFPMGPDSEVALFEEDDDVFYVKMTDANNFPSLRKFRFTEEPLEVPNKEQYVTIDEFNKLKEELENAKQFIRKQTAVSETYDIPEHAGHASWNVSTGSDTEQYSTNQKFDGYSKK